MLKAVAIVEVIISDVFMKQLFQDLLLIMNDEDCYFVSFPDRQEDQLDDTYGHYESNGRTRDHEHYTSSLKATEVSVFLLPLRDFLR